MGTYYFFNLVRSAWIRAHDEVTRALKPYGEDGMDYKDAACVIERALHECAEDVLDGILWIAPSGFDAPRSFYTWLHRTHDAIMEINYHEPEPNTGSRMLHLSESTYERRHSVRRAEQKIFNEEKQGDLSALVNNVY